MPNFDEETSTGSAVAENTTPIYVKAKLCFDHFLFKDYGVSCQTCLTSLFDFKVKI